MSSAHLGKRRRTAYLLAMIAYSLLDLSPIPQGSSPSAALANTLDLARHAEDWGYNRYWLAEHHNMKGIASAKLILPSAEIGPGHSEKLPLSCG